MKKLFAVLLAGMMFCGCQDEIIKIEGTQNSPVTRSEIKDGSTDDYYWLGDEKIPLRKMENKFYVMYDSENEGKFMTELSKTGTELDEVQDNDLLQYADIKAFDSKKLSGLKTATIEGDYEKIAPVLSYTFYSAPYYKTGMGEGKLTNRFSIALKDVADLPQLEKLARENFVDILGVSGLDGWYELACSNLSAGNSLEMANLFYETGLFESVGYDLGARGRIENINEPLYTNGTLWHLGNNTTNPNIHINYIAARAIVPQVSSTIKIAIIDSGVQWGHSDLYNVSQGWNADAQSSPNAVSHPHGTQVAGFIAAKPNNGQAVAGVAYGATVYPISFTADSNPNNNIPDGTILSSYQVMVRAVNRAVSEGAKVINCSWSYLDNRVANAVGSALNSGRIVVFASGNAGVATIGSPANSDPGIIVVGAVNENGMRASFSNYGSQLDVVAPGYNLASTTVGSGYAYITGIQGTSFAAPQVSAIAALVLSVNPNLTRQQVTDAIIKSANRYPYRNNEYGYGLVNALGAIGMAYLNNVSLTGPDRPYPYTSVSYSASNIPSGVTFNNWAITPSTYVASGTTGSNLNVTFNNPGTYILKARFRTPSGVIIESLPKTVTVPDVTPFITADVSGWGHEGNPVRFIVYNSHPTGTYQWVVNGMPAANSSHIFDTTITFGSGSTMVVECRVYVNRVWSAWSAPYTIQKN